MSQTAEGEGLSLHHPHLICRAAPHPSLPPPPPPPPSPPLPPSLTPLPSRASPSAPRVASPSASVTRAPACRGLFRGGPRHEDPLGGPQKSPNGLQLQLSQAARENSREGRAVKRGQTPGSPRSRGARLLRPSPSTGLRPPDRPEF